MIAPPLPPPVVDTATKDRATFGRRMTMLATAFLLMFGVLSLRLWALQVAEGSSRASLEAAQQTVVEIATQAPRGDVVDRLGKLLVTSKYVPAVVIDRRRLDPDQKVGLLQRLSSLLDLPVQELDDAYEDAGVNGRFVAATVDTVTAYRIAERVREFPGVVIEKVPLRVYPGGTSMAHLLGHLGLPNQDDVAAEPGLDLNVRIGKLGIEKAYDRFLRGEPGRISYRVDRESEIIEESPEKLAVQGSTVQLTVDLDLQVVVEKALQDGIELSNEVKADERRDPAIEKKPQNETKRGAIVVLDIDSGAVLALASAPSFDPGIFAGRLDEAQFQQLNSQRAFIDLAVAGLYPPASTFKAVTYVASLQEDLPLAGPNYDPQRGLVKCDGVLELPGFEEGSQQSFKDWYYPRKFGWLDLSGSFENSCNIYFWSVALGIWNESKETLKENVLQHWARDLGFGTPTGIDLPSEAAGVIPDRALYEEWKRQQLAFPDRPARISPSRLKLESPWVGGDLMNFAIGQGDVLVTPLQLGQAYATVINGGTVWRPYVAEKVVSRDGSILYQAEPKAVNRVDIDTSTVHSFISDMGKVVRSGTAKAAFRDFGPGLANVGGKTGTAQAGKDQDNHAWFVGVAPLDEPKYLVVVLLEEGLSGGKVASPAGRYIMQYLMGQDPTPIVAGENAD